VCSWFAAWLQKGRPFLEIGVLEVLPCLRNCPQPSSQSPSSQSPAETKLVDRRRVRPRLVVSS
jgi:hypothetical protein